MNETPVALQVLGETNNELLTRATVANAIAISEAVISNLIGVELSAVKSIDLEKHLAAVIGTEINKAIGRFEGVVQ